MEEEVTCTGVQWQIISKPRPKRKSLACKRCVFTTQTVTGSKDAAASGTFYFDSLCLSLNHGSITQPVLEPHLSINTVKEPKSP